jgi:hypothetical protein
MADPGDQFGQGPGEERGAARGTSFRPGMQNWTAFSSTEYDMETDLFFFSFTRATV